MLDLLKYAVRQAELQGAKEAEAYAVQSSESEVFIENNDLKQSKSQTSSVLGIRVIIDGGSLGFYSVNSFDKTKISDSVAKALKVARISPKDKHSSLPSVKSKVRLLSGIWDRNAKSFHASEAAKMAFEMLSAARGFDPRVSVDSGNFSAASIMQAIANSNGMHTSEKISTFFWSLMGMAIDNDDVSSFDVQSGSTHHLKKIDVVKTAKEFAQNVIGSLGARKIDSFKGTMLLTPAATGEIVAEAIAHSINSDAVQRKSSRFANKIGKSVSSDLLSVYDDATNVEGLSASSFDREGVPHKRVPVIEKGVLRKFIYNTYTAKKDDTRTTGNAGGSANAPPSVSTTNFEIKAGRSSFESLRS
jgi:PmbA protein